MTGTACRRSLGRLPTSNNPASTTGRRGPPPVAHSDSALVRAADGEEAGGADRRGPPPLGGRTGHRDRRPAADRAVHALGLLRARRPREAAATPPAVPRRRVAHPGGGVLPPGAGAGIARRAVG